MKQINKVQILYSQFIFMGDWETEQEQAERRARNKRRNEEYREMFADKTIEELIDAFNEEQPKHGWVSSRASLLAGLREGFRKHTEIDCSAFLSETGMSLKYQIRLEKNVIIQFGEEKRRN